MVWKIENQTRTSIFEDEGGGGGELVPLWLVDAFIWSARLWWIAGDTSLPTLDETSVVANHVHKNSTLKMYIDVAQLVEQLSGTVSVLGSVQLQQIWKSSKLSEIC